MEDPKILVLGDNKDYCMINTDKDYLKEVVPKVIGDYKENLFDALKLEEKVSAKDTKIYSGRINLESSIDDNAVDSLYDLLQKTKDLGKKHNVPYVLIQEFKLKGRGHCNQSLEAYLLIEQNH